MREVYESGGSYGISNRMRVLSPFLCQICSSLRRLSSEARFYGLLIFARIFPDVSGDTIRRFIGEMDAGCNGI
jgi:hypothetical protein